MSRLRLGELLNAAGLLPVDALDEALRRQEHGGRRLGEQLIAMGLLEREELPELLSLQSALRTDDGTVSKESLAERLRIGRLLVDAGVIEPAALDAALERSRASGRRVGETLVESGALSAPVLERFLDRQRRLLAVAFAGLALLGALPPEAHAADRARIDVNAQVLRRAQIEHQQLPQHIEVSAQDVARGYVDVAEPVELGIRSNVPSGVSVGFALNSPQLAAVDVLAAHGGEVRAEGVFVPQVERGLRASRLSMHLRLWLAPQAAPGTIPTPLGLTLVLN